MFGTWFRAVAVAVVVGPLRPCLAEDDCLECDMKMLQLDAKVSDRATKKLLSNCGHLTQETCDPHANYPCSNNCPVHTHGHDCYRPVPEVMAEHPGEDGYCYFNQTGFWVAPMPAEPDFLQSAIGGILTLRDLPVPKGAGYPSPYRGLHTGPVLTFHFEGKVITTQADAAHYSYDDLYGYSLGYLQGQGLSIDLVRNSTAWIAASKQKCDEIQQTYNFQNHELVLADWLDYNAVIGAKVSCAAKQPAAADSAVLEKAKFKSVDDCEPVTARDFAKHHYIKCLLGYPNSASDGAYLNVRACLLDGGTRIGHFSDCPFSPDVSF
ncbi:unnamed protein product [Cladocopium goreaui]|uniref:Uncharacterized protein n=1 Tax=Cladocopium goreaui TaxID=2562237 RepID=A0A9P1FSB5_9DINO|nr:unnamed protein product [Cladocopium goreaui]